MDRMLPPLRIVLNNECNGNCPFCHNEGNISFQNMSLNTIEECANAANFMDLPYISITGGEPTFREDLPEIIQIIHKKTPNSKLSLTTNGYLLDKLEERLLNPLDTLNLSFSSFEHDVAKRYQNVDPQKVLHTFKKFPAKNKNLNIVITPENYYKVSNFIEYCTFENISLDIMFNLKDCTELDIKMQEYVFKKLEDYQNAKIVINTTPKLQIKVTEECKINVKHPFFSSLPEYEVCNNCNFKSVCLERVCAVRVMPDETVTFCLNRNIKSNKPNVYDKIIDAYNILNKSRSFLSFIYK